MVLGTLPPSSWTISCILTLCISTVTVCCQFTLYGPRHPPTIVLDNLLHPHTLHIHCHGLLSVHTLWSSALCHHRPGQSPASSHSAYPLSRSAVSSHSMVLGTLPPSSWTISCILTLCISTVTVCWLDRSGTKFLPALQPGPGHRTGTVCLPSGWWTTWTVKHMEHC